jgi:hypothetical protein
VPAVERDPVCRHCAGRGVLAEGNLISVGTDGLSSSPSLDVLDDVRALRP